MLSQYRALLARARARLLVCACALAWIAFTSYALALILAVHAATRSFSVAGAAVAAFSVGSGLGAPARGRLIDSRGPASLAIFAAAHTGVAAGLAVACALRAPSSIVLALSALAGVSVPPVIATARMLWADVAGAELTRAAHALNASLADAAQLLSPGLIAGLAALFAPSLALGVVIAAAGVAGMLVAAVGRQRSPSRRASRRRFWGVMADSAGLRTLVSCHIAGGLWTGAFEVTLTSLAAGRGSAELAAIPLGLAALGGIAGSLWVGSRSASRPAAVRYLGGSVAVAVVLPLTLIEPSLATVTGIALLAGAGYGVLNAALFELLDHAVSSDRAVEAFTWLTLGQAAGTAAGAAIGGALAQRASVDALAVVCVSAGAAAGIALIRRGSLGV